MYVDPNEVLSPRDSWELIHVLINTGPGGWSAAEGRWNGEPCLAMRWNGSDSESGRGNPQSRGHATWFVVPDDIAHLIREEIGRLSTGVVSCEIERPEGYDFGAWRVVAKLNPVLLQTLSHELLFKIPELPHRFCHPEKGYVRMADGVYGCFQNGKWLGDLYTNGLPEEGNPTSIEAFREAMTRNIELAVEEAKTSA